MPSKEKNIQRLRSVWTLWKLRIRRNVPPGFRIPVGLLLIVGGLFGILPVLGFWMIPLGVAVIAMDIAPIAAPIAAAIRRWLGKGGS